MTSNLKYSKVYVLHYITDSTDIPMYDSKLTSNCTCDYFYSCIDPVHAFLGFLAELFTIEFPGLSSLLSYIPFSFLS
jgi:hypothetical protein